MYVTYASAKLYKHLYKHQYLNINLQEYVMKSGQQMKGIREQGITVERTLEGALER